MKGQGPFGRKLSINYDGRGINTAIAKDELGVQADSKAELDRILANNRTSAARPFHDEFVEEKGVEGGESEAWLAPFDLVWHLGQTAALRLALSICLVNDQTLLVSEERDRVESLILIS